MSSSDPGARPSAAATGAAWGRFIPREELGAFAAWRPGTLGGEPGHVGARADAAAPVETLQAQLAAVRQAGYQDGYRDGLAALESFKASFARANNERIGALLDGFDAELLALEQRIAGAVADAATQLARHVVRGELAVQPQLVAQVAQEALSALLLSARHIRVHVHPDDQPLVADGAGEALAARGARLVADSTLERGGCRVESDIAVVDATLATRWSRACAALGTTLALAGDADDTPA